MLGAIVAGPFAYVVWQFVTDGGHWRGTRAATACWVLGLPMFLIGSLLAFKHAEMPLDGSSLLVMGPVIASVVVFRFPIDDRRIHTTVRNGPAGLAALIMFGVLFGGLIWWRSDIHPAPLDTARFSNTYDRGPVSGPTWEEQVCDAAIKRAQDAVFRANLRNEHEFAAKMVLTPDDMDAEAFGPTGFSWFVDETAGRFRMLVLTPC